MSLLGTYSSGSYRGWQSATQFYNKFAVMYPNTITTNQRVGYKVSINYSGIVIHATTDPNSTLKRSYAWWDQFNTGTYTQVGSFSAFDSPSPTAFGSGLTTNGSTWVVGDYLNNGNGAVYITNVSPEQKLSGPSGSWFGYSVSNTIDDEFILVGAPAANRAYLYILSGGTWVLQQTINAPAGAQDFGWDVSLTGTNGNLRAVIGAPSTTVSGAAGTGTAYIYSGSSQLTTLQATVNGFTGAGLDYFGRSVSMSENGNYVVVGSEGSYNGSVRPGAAYVYVRSGSTWSLQQKLLGTSQVAGDLFGCSVSINDDGNRVAIGSYGYDSGQTDKGACYVFFRNNTLWSQNNLIVPPNESGFSPGHFGFSVAMANDGSKIAIGAPRWDYSLSQGNTGAVFVYY